jgi:colicin import membrane protein
MRGPSLQKTALLSIALHLTAFLIVFLILRQSNRMVMSSPYTVSLVSPNVLTGVDKGKNNEDVVRETKEPSGPSDVPKKSKKEAVKEKKLIEDKISALAAKKKKIDTLSKLHEIISLKAGGDKRGADSKKTAPIAGKGNASEDYSSRIMDGIQPYWNLPDGIGKKGLEAIVSIKILKDGIIIFQGWEKRSGNTLFDRSALQAIYKAYRLPPPPYEMEIGVKFHP